MGELLALLFQQHAREVAWPLERLARDQLAGGINRRTAVLRAPRADAVEVLEAEADRVHARVARGARRVVAMLLHLLAERAGELPAVLEVGHIRRRRWRRRAEDVFENPLAALDRRRARGVRGDRENAAVSEHAEPRRAA